MKKLITFVILILTINSVFSQNRKNWTELDYLNAEESYPFQTEKNITGDFFVTISESFNYENPIIIKDLENKEIVRIEVNENNAVTTFHDKEYSYNDFSNPLNLWVTTLNPDYFQLVFEGIDVNSKYYVVRLNENELGYIEKENSDFKKLSIHDFIKTRVNGVDFDRSTNALKKDPKENGKIITNPNSKKYKIWRSDILEIEGDWIKVRTIKGEVGWVKWREGEKVLIRMYYTC